MCYQIREKNWVEWKIYIGVKIQNPGGNCKPLEDLDMTTVF